MQEHVLFVWASVHEAPVLMKTRSSTSLACRDLLKLLILSTYYYQRKGPTENSTGSLFIYIYIYIYIYTYTHTHTHTECPRRNVPDFGRVFLMLKYTDIT